jgi:hypothetical protein
VAQLVARGERPRLPDGACCVHARVFYVHECAHTDRMQLPSMQPALRVLERCLSASPSARPSADKVRVRACECTYYMCCCARSCASRCRAGVASCARRCRRDRDRESERVLQCARLSRSHDARKCVEVTQTRRAVHCVHLTCDLVPLAD